MDLKEKITKKKQRFDNIVLPILHMTYGELFGYGLSEGHSNISTTYKPFDDYMNTITRTIIYGNNPPHNVLEKDIKIYKYNGESQLKCSQLIFLGNRCNGVFKDYLLICDDNMNSSNGSIWRGDDEWCTLFHLSFEEYIIRGLKDLVY